jgi:hypothetical protein
VRAREFIAEGSRGGTRSSATHDFEQAHPGMVGPGGQGDVYWGRYYDHYRVATLAGMHPDDIAKMDEINFFGNLPIFSAYTEHDRNKLKAIMKKLKMKPKDYISTGSYESDDTNHTSPVTAFKGYNK